MARLALLDVDEVKLDRSVVRTLPGDTRRIAAVGQVLEAATAAALDVTVKGVETPDQLHAIRSVGGRLVQGFLFGRPRVLDGAEHVRMLQTDGAGRCWTRSRPLAVRRRRRPRHPHSSDGIRHARSPPLPPNHPIRMRPAHPVRRDARDHLRGRRVPADGGGGAVNVVHARPNRTGTDVDIEALDWRAGLLAPVVRLVVEGALEAELDAHLADRSQIRPCGVQRRNARNGSRSKTVRTAFGEVTIDAPRDRGGRSTPSSSASGSAASSASTSSRSRWRRSAPTSVRASPCWAGSTAGRRLRHWPRACWRRSSTGCSRGTAGRCRARPARCADRAVVRSKDGRVASTPVRTVVAEHPDGWRQLVSLRAAPQRECLDSWYACLTDLSARGLSDVEAVVAAPVPGLDDVVARVWRDAVRIDRDRPGGRWPEAVPA